MSDGLHPFTDLGGVLIAHDPAVSYGSIGIAQTLLKAVENEMDRIVPCGFTDTALQVLDLLLVQQPEADRVCQHEFTLSDGQVFHSNQIHRVVDCKIITDDLLRCGDVL